MCDRLTIIGLVIVIAISALAAINAESLNFLFYDDAFYYLDMVRSGDVLFPTTNGFTPTTGYHPLWYWLLELFSLVLGTGLILPTFAAGLCLCISYMIWIRPLYRLSGTRPRAVILSLFLHLFPSVLLIAFSGMETALLMLAMGLFVSVVTTEPEFRLSALGIACFTAASCILFLTRTDMIFLVVPSLVCCYIYLDRAVALKSGIVLGVCAACYLAYNYMTAGFLIQTSSTMYSAIRWSEISGVGTYLSKLLETGSVAFYTIMDVCLVLFPPLLFAVAYRRIPIELRWIIWGAWALLIVHVGFRFVFANWYAVVYFVLGFVMLACLIDRRTVRLVVGWVSLAFVLSFAFACSLVWTDVDIYSRTTLFQTWDKHNRPLDQIAATKLLREEGYDGNFGAFNSGEFGYYEQRVINLDGLMNTQIIRAYSHGSSAVARYLRDNDVQVIIDVPVYFVIFSDVFPLDSLRTVAEIKHSSNAEQTATIVAVVRDSPLDSILMTSERFAAERRNLSVAGTWQKGL